MYLSQGVYLIGLLFVSLPAGAVFFFFSWATTLVQLIGTRGGEGSFEAWLEGPAFSNLVVQPFIWLASLVLGLIPGFNFISAFLFGWWANLEYYGYNYELFAGPTPPKAE